MPATDPLHLIRDIGVIPVVEVPALESTDVLAQGLLEGGLRCVEITLRTESALASIARLSSAYPELLIGAGTVRRPDEVRAAADAGARFVVTPGLRRAVIEAALDRGIPILPGVATPSEIETAAEYGLTTVKVFPIALLGGPAYIRALAGPFRDVGFVPTGGVSQATLGEYLAIPAVLAVGGSWIAPSAVLEAGDVETVRTRAALAVSTVRELRP